MKKIILPLMMLTGLTSYAESYGYKEGFTETLIIIVACIIGSFIWLHVAKSVLGLGKILKHQKVQTALMLRIAKQNGVSENDLMLLIKEVEPTQGEYQTNRSLAEMIKNI